MARLFARVREESGRLDILVNNATFLHDELIMPGPFWQKPLEMAGILDVGLRSGYVASWHAAPIMAAQGHGLIVFTSSFGANCYMHGPAYGAQKAGIDKFAHDMAVDLRPYGVAAVSLWMGPLRTARTLRVWEKHPDKYAGFAPVAETPEFTGRIIDALYRDPALMDKSGRVLIGAEAALAYGIVDAEGVQPPSYRQALGGRRRCIRRLWNRVEDAGAFALAITPLPRPLSRKRERGANKRGLLPSLRQQTRREHRRPDQPRTINPRILIRIAPGQERTRTTGIIQRQVGQIPAALRRVLIQHTDIPLPRKMHLPQRGSARQLCKALNQRVAPGKAADPVIVDMRVVRHEAGAHRVGILVIASAQVAQLERADRLRGFQPRHAVGNGGNFGHDRFPVDQASRNWYFSTLPAALTGSDVTNSTSRGTL